jgi:hypothetical protein
MSIERFDDLAISLADGKLSRRRALRLLGGALLGGMFTTIAGLPRWALLPRDTCSWRPVLA